ncbi:MAG: hypothetical protein Q9195_007307 [Heterodermia aff. obscurata]
MADSILLTSLGYFLSRESSKLYDTTGSWKPLLRKGQNFLEVSDIPFSPEEPATLLLKTTDVFDVNDALRNLPAQSIHTIRVAFIEIGFDKEISPLKTRSFPGSPTMISQWGPPSKERHWQTCSYSLSLEPTLKAFIAHLKRHRVERPSPQAAYAYHSHFCESLRHPIKAYMILGAQTTSALGLKQLLLLRYSHALVEEYVDLVYGLQTNYARRKEGLSDPRRATLTLPMLAEITRDTCFYEEVNEGAAELAGAVDILVESLKILLMDAANFHDYQHLAVELQSTCKDVKRMMSTLLTTSENHLRLFELSRGMQEAQSVHLLTLLASIFLPLSLACGLLSMQTRFAQLHYLLYDFCGVLVLLGTIVAVILIVLRFFSSWKKLLTQLDRNRIFKKYIRPNVQYIFFGYLVLGWSLLLSSFLVGMIKDVGLGLKILYAAVGIGQAVLTFPLALVLMFQLLAKIGL